ncbi:MAG TPA: hypothetical protein VFX15_03260 [Actinomycetes bacterium]|nr:hypothetical protein [Actinomycetes bacterium]
MKRKVALVITVEVNSGSGPLTRAEARKEAREFIDMMLGTYRGSSMSQRSYVNSSIAHSRAVGVRFTD